LAFLERVIPYKHPKPYIPSWNNRTMEIGIMYMIDYLSSQEKEIYSLSAYDPLFFKVYHGLSPVFTLF
jgi:hypothetical protein